jgi:predicted amidohydrolase
MKDKKVNVALLQLSASNDLDENFAKAEKALRDVKEKGADIGLLPELWTIGYEACPDDEDENKNWKQKSIWPGHSEYDRYLRLAKNVGIAILVTFLESNKQRSEFYNTAVLIDSDGRDILKYRKTHLVDKGWESMFVAGEEFPVASLNTNKGAVKIGIMICYDREFPEVARMLMLNGAEIVLVPNACILESNRIAQFQCRGFENMIGVAMTNYPGSGFDGRSVAFDGMRKKGEDYDPLLVMADESESINIARFDIDKLREYREREIWGDAYRRPHIYGALTENNPKAPFKREDARR